MAKRKQKRPIADWEREFIKNCVEKGWSVTEMMPHLPHRSLQTVYVVAKRYGYIGEKKRKALERGETVNKPPKPPIRKGEVYDICLYWVKAGGPVPNEKPESFRYIKRTMGKNPLNIFEHLEGKWKIALTDYETIEALKKGAMKRKW